MDPLVSLMKVEKVPDSTYDMVGGLDQQIKEIKEVRALFWCMAACLIWPMHHLLVCHAAGSLDLGL